MNQVLDRFLCDRFPSMYRDRNGDKLKTAMAWGFSCGDGWFPILFELSEKIDAELCRFEATTPFVDGAKYTKSVRLPQRGDFFVTQVKEKFGTLRFYVVGGSPEIDLLITEAEEKSGKTCEDCGAPGVLRGKHWVKTTCEKCAKGALPVECEITQRPCDKGTIGCSIDHSSPQNEESI